MKAGERVVMCADGLGATGRLELVGDDGLGAWRAGGDVCLRAVMCADGLGATGRLELVGGDGLGAWRAGGDDVCVRVVMCADGLGAVMCACGRGVMGQVVYGRREYWSWLVMM